VHFVYALALAVTVLVAAPYFAHRLRRRRGEERLFAGARLVPPAPPRARRRSRLEDRALFATRAFAVVALAVLGASPLVRCSRLALQRSSGASVAIALVVDDSMSMRVVRDGTSASSPGGLRLGPGRSRFELAQEGARQLLASTREGDAVAIVLAGAPARVALAATTDLGAARAAIDTLTQSDRATDLDGALGMARALVAQLPQVDRRVVVLSDLADGHPDAPPIGEGSDMPTWVAMPELREPAQDCAILTADRRGPRVRVRIGCSHDATPAGREVTLTLQTPRERDKVVARGPAPTSESGETTLMLEESASADPSKPATSPAHLELLVAHLTGTDAIAADDSAPVVVEAGPGTVAVVADAVDELAVTGGPPVVEQALAALELDIAVRPIPALPDRSEDLAPFAGAILDDPPGFTPEERRALGTFLEGGGAVLLALGPRAAAAPLGASLEPILPHAILWSGTPVPGADASSAVGTLAESAQSLEDLAAKARATLAPEDVGGFEPLLKWGDGSILVAKRAIGRGEAWIVTLPFAIDASDLPVRPAFLALLDAWASEARARAAPRRTDVGVAWTFPGARSVEVEGPGGRLLTTADGALARVVPPLLGAYTAKVDGKTELRVAALVPRELDLRPRAAAPAAGGSGLGDSHAAIDVSSWVALLLLGLVALEMALRLRARARVDAGESVLAER
jgi:hypothetical protein